MRLAWIKYSSLVIMHRHYLGSNNRSRQPTLAGLWKRSNDGISSGGDGDGPETSREVKRDRVSSLQLSPSQPGTPPLHVSRHINVNSAHWEDISLPNGPMHLLRGCVGGANSHERRLTREALASLPDWNENVKFKIFGKECQMRRVSFPAIIPSD